MLLCTVHISASIQDLTTTNVSLRVTCTKVLHSSQISAVVIGVVQNEEDQAKYPVRLYCNSSLETFKFMELQQNTHYNVTVISSNTSCVVTNFTTLLSECMYKYSNQSHNCVNFIMILCIMQVVHLCQEFSTQTFHPKFVSMSAVIMI